MKRTRFYRNTINGYLWITYTKGTAVYRRFGRLRGKVHGHPHTLQRRAGTAPTRGTR